LERRIRQYIAENGSIKASDLKYNSKSLGQVFRQMPDLKIIKKEEVDYYMCARASVNVWGFK
jgi:hypothetical protein